MIKKDISISKLTERKKCDWSDYTKDERQWWRQKLQKRKHLFQCWRMWAKLLKSLNHCQENGSFCHISIFDINNKHLWPFNVKSIESWAIKLILIWVVVCLSDFLLSCVMLTELCVRFLTELAGCCDSTFCFTLL